MWDNQCDPAFEETDKSAGLQKRSDCSFSGKLPAGNACSCVSVQMGIQSVFAQPNNFFFFFFSLFVQLLRIL